MTADQGPPQEEAAVSSSNPPPRWVCDVCETAKFENFDDACRHEEQCAKLKKEKEQAKNQLCKAVHPFFTGVAKKPVTTTSRNPSKPSNNDIGTSSSNDKDKRRKRDSKNDENTDGRQKKKKTSQCQKKNELSSGPNNKSEEGTTKSRKKVLQDAIADSSQAKLTQPKNAKDQQQMTELQNSSLSEDSLNGSAATNKRKSRAAGDAPGPVQTVNVKPAKKKTKNQKSTSKTATTKSKTENFAAAPMASIFQRGNDGKAIDEKTLMAEQVAAEFQAKRRLERERERKRQQKRQEAFSQKKPESKAAAAQSAGTLQIPNDNCPRFPVPNHVLGEEPSEEPFPERSYTHVTDEQLQEGRKKLQKILPYPRKDTLQFTSDSETPWEFGSSASWLPEDAVGGSIQSKLAKILSVVTDRPTDDHRLWIDNYALDLEGVCGVQNQRVAQEIVGFIQEWMVDRHHANVRMAERQKALQKTKKITKKQRKILYKDDDEWMDSDEENNELPSFCLIQGPVASSKSSLVYAAARHCGCEVLELNTSDKRGATSLRKALEEATQSLSSLDMLKKSKNSLFARGELVDSDDEDAQTKEKGASLTCVLVDEVDNVFESFGDSGFWGTLADLSRRARCPIFLTCNLYPKELDSASVKFMHFTTFKPSAEECRHRMALIMSKEGIAPLHEEDSQELDLIVEDCGYDLRRIIHELQLFAITRKFLPLADENLDPTTQTQESDEFLELRPVSSPTVLSISPRTVPANSCTLLTIKGIHFDNFMSSPAQLPYGYPVNVLVGSQLCPSAFIVDDKTILAVCPPSRRNADVDEFGLRYHRKTGIKMTSLDTVYVPLEVGVIQPSCAMSLTTTKVVPHSLLDNSKISVVSVPNVLYSFPERAPNIANGRQIQSMGEEDADEVEAEFVLGSSELGMNSKLSLSDRMPFESSSLEKQVGGLASMDIGQEKIKNSAEVLLQEGLRKLKLSEFPVSRPPTNLSMQTKPDIGDSLESLAKDYELASDAVLLESYGSLPYLSGACPGFGFTFTPEGDANALSMTSSKLAKHEDSTQCSEERLIAMGWKDTACFYGDNEAYMTMPSSQRELRLIKLSETLARNRSCAISEIAGSASQEEGAFEDETDFVMWSPPDSKRSDEDCFLPRPVPTPLEYLPSLLLYARKYPKCINFPKEELLESRRKTTADVVLRLVGPIFTGKARTKMFCLGLGRSRSSPLEFEYDSNLFLEYIPMLRNIAIHERSAESDPESETTRDSSRRSTRGSAKRGRPHFFERLSDSFRLGETEFTARETAQKLASSLLLYANPSNRS